MYCTVLYIAWQTTLDNIASQLICSKYFVCSINRQKLGIIFFFLFYLNVFGLFISLSLCLSISAVIARYMCRSIRSTSPCSLIFVDFLNRNFNRSTLELIISILVRNFDVLRPYIYFNPFIVPK